MCEPDPYFVPTRSSSFKCPKHELVKFKNDKRVKKPDNDIEKSMKNTPSDSNEGEISMKQARFEVYKFAQSALSAPEKQKSKIELAIKLGAKAPKNKNTNYKQLKENKKKELEEARRNKDMFNAPIRKEVPLHKSKLNKGTLRMKRKVGSGILNVYGKVTKRMINKKR